MVDLELREHTEAANATAARTSEPMAPWVVEALREEFLDDGAVELGIDVGAIDIVLTEHAVHAIQVDTHAPTAAPTPSPTPGPASVSASTVSEEEGLLTYATSLVGSMTGGSSGYVFVGVAVSALLVSGTVYAAYVRVLHPSRKNCALSTKAQQGESRAANYAPESVTPKSKTTTPNTTTPSSKTPTTATQTPASTHANGRTVLSQSPPDLELQAQADEVREPISEEGIALGMPGAGPTDHIADAFLDVEAADSAVAGTGRFFSCTPCKPHAHMEACTCHCTPCTCTPCTPCGGNVVVASIPASRRLEQAPLRTEPVQYTRTIERL